MAFSGDDVPPLSFEFVGVDGHRQRIPIHSQLVQQISLDSFSGSLDIDVEHTGGVVTQNLFLRSVSKLRILVLFDYLVGNLVGLKCLNRPMRRSKYRRVGSPKDMVLSEPYL